MTQYQLTYQDDNGRGVVRHTSDQAQLEREADKLANQGIEFNIYVQGVEGVAGHAFRTDEGELTWACDYYSEVAE